MLLGTVCRAALSRFRAFCVPVMFFFFHAEDGIRVGRVTGVQTCALPIWSRGLLQSATEKCRVGNWEGASSIYPPSQFPTLHFSVADCSKPLDPAPPEPFDLIFRSEERPVGNARTFPTALDTV